ncbi:MAG: hypothetical protein Q9207_005681 [Kuettlingeria erythrocarpa]
MVEALENKLQLCVTFIVEQLELRNHHIGNKRPPPFFLGINGVQGIGKSFLVSEIASLLEKALFRLHTVVISIDDFYLAHADQVQLAAAHPDNPLVQHRGQPSTHDLGLAISVLSSLRAGREVTIPAYDKSAFEGQGDRVPQDEWIQLNRSGHRPIDVVILEGWCLGFSALDDAELTTVWEEARKGRNQDQEYCGRLGHNRLNDVKFVNDALKGYDAITNQLDALIHLDAEDPQYVYEWRLEQEAGLRRDKGCGMTEKQVVDFVNGYYPSYELFTRRLRAGAFDGRKGNQLRLVIGKERDVKEVVLV